MGHKQNISQQCYGWGGKKKSQPTPQYTRISINGSIIRKAHKRIFTLHLVVWPQLEYNVWDEASHGEKQPPFSPLENKRNDLENTLSKERLKELGLFSLDKR